jgi:hypothetical protein
MAEKRTISKDVPPDVITKDIAVTRGEMSHTIDEIQERLSARHWTGVVKETVMEKVDRAKAGGKEFADRTRESARKFGRAARERSAEVKDRMPQVLNDKRAAASALAFELGAWIVIASRSAINRKRRLQMEKASGPADYAKAKIMTIEEVEQKVEKAALAPEEGSKKAA